MRASSPARSSSLASPTWKSPVEMSSEACAIRGVAEALSVGATKSAVKKFAAFASSKLSSVNVPGVTSRTVRADVRIGQLEDEVATLREERNQWRDDDLYFVRPSYRRSVILRRHPNKAGPITIAAAIGAVAAGLVWNSMRNRRPLGNPSDPIQ